MMTFPEACQYLDTFINYETHLGQITKAAFTLKRFKELLAAIGNPHDKFQSIHVAGTKGKGSTCVLTAEILRQHGFRTGLYTSPHLLNIRERIQLLDPQASPKGAEEFFAEAISDKAFCETLSAIQPALEKFKSHRDGPPTYFEVLTAMAFDFFAREKVTYAVLETGLGGRLDATNVVNPKVCGLTPISLEHTNILGKTLSAIAAEKAGIIKNSYPVVVAPQNDEVMPIIQNRCQELHAKPYYIGKDILAQMIEQNEGEMRFRVQTPKATYELTTGFLGQHQCQNAAMAVALVELLPGMGAEIVTQKVSHAAQKWFLPGRFQILRRRPLLILDVAHTPESVALVGATIQNLFPRQKVFTVLGVSQDKDVGKIIDSISRFSDQLILTRAHHPRAMAVADIEARDIRSSKTKSVAEALSQVLTAAQEKDVILITGSFFVIAEAMNNLQG